MHCYILNLEAVGLKVFEVIFLSFSHYKSMDTNDPLGLANLDSRGRIYVDVGATRYCYILNIYRYYKKNMVKIIYATFIQQHTITISAVNPAPCEHLSKQTPS